MGRKKLWKRLKPRRLKDISADEMHALKGWIRLLDASPHDVPTRMGASAAGMSVVYGLADEDFAAMDPEQFGLVGESALKSTRLLVDAMDRLDVPGLHARALARAGLDDEELEILEGRLEAHAEELEEALEEEHDVLVQALEDLDEKREEERERLRERLEEEEERVHERADKQREEAEEGLEEALEQLEDEKESLRDTLEKLDERREEQADKGD